MDTILILDDEKSIVDLLSVVFHKEGYEVKTWPETADIFDFLTDEDFDLLLTDIRMPRTNGMDILEFMIRRKPEVPVVMMTAYGTIKQAVAALKAGAFDYIMKPFDVDELKIVAANALEKRRLKQENVQLKKELEEKNSFGPLVGKSKMMKEVYNLIEKVAGTDSTVIILGESGTGKELAARSIHTLSRRREQTFISINCAALPESLLESELFGHVKGSFTGAVGDKKGVFEAAQKGTLFLDEVAEMSLLTQVKLFRALQERKIRRVGGAEEIPFDVRIIAATNQDLKKRIEEGKFREELFYRLNVISFEMPALRKKTEDIPILVSQFLQKYCHRMNKKMKRMTPDVIGHLESYAWPGNVRELENVIERIVAIEDRETITAACLPPEIVAPREPAEESFVLMPDFDLEAHIAEVTKKYILEARRLSGGNLKKAASILGLSYRSLRYLIEKHDLKGLKENLVNGEASIPPRTA
ncbi:MAG: Fis family transcriptional regulator [Candidatus Aminicenantes bacterium RBG_13_63_10]|nr:MAG: Fis family transcriptional regulator [Candidatus Aminicenantes bacterium RBG_13_63_10]